MTAVFQYLRVCQREEGFDLFLIAPESRSSSRSNGWKLFKERPHLEQKRNFLTVRTVDPCNSVPPAAVGVPSLEVCKKRLDNYGSIRTLLYCLVQ